ncbi:MAG: hypothetical protein WBF53_15565 [Litorimonas sp.]
MIFGYKTLAALAALATLSCAATAQASDAFNKFPAMAATATDQPVMRKTAPQTHATTRTVQVEAPRTSVRTLRVRRVVEPLHATPTSAPDSSPSAAEARFNKMRVDAAGPMPVMFDRTVRDGR